jgi:hypothetical protein
MSCKAGNLPAYVFFPAFRDFLVTLPQSSIVSRMGTLSPTDWTQVASRIKLAIGLT